MGTMSYEYARSPPTSNGVASLCKTRIVGYVSSRCLPLESSMQPVDARMAACDLFYCLHWSIRHAELSNSKVPGAVSSYVIIARRRALEWLIGSEQRDEVTLDT